MDIFAIVTQTLSLLFMTYLIYLFTKNKPFILFILIGLYGILIFFTNDYELIGIVDLLIYQGIPLLLTLVFWLVYLKNELFFSKKVSFKRKRFKLYDKIFTVKFYRLISSLLVGLFTLVLVIVILFAKTSSLYLTLVIMSAILLLSSLIYFVKWFINKDDVAIIITGKTNLTYYQNANPFNKYVIENKSLINNDSFILDPVGEIDIKELNTRFFIYWIKTDMKIDLSTSDVSNFNSFDLSKFIDIFDKYQYHYLILNNLNDLSIIKHERLK